MRSLGGGRRSEDRLGDEGFRRLVRALWAAQRASFRNGRTSEQLWDARRLEAAVDRELEDPGPPGLFDGGAGGARGSPWLTLGAS